MLDILRRIVQEVSSATDLSDALKVVVARIRAAMNTEVCSVYLFDPESKRYVLMATEGLKQEAVGRVSLSSSQGLVGLVGSREEPINVDNAPTHPRFHFLSETGEDPFLSFLGVPIIHHKRLMGVMVVQQRDSRQFDESEEAFLVTMSAQLAGVIAHAEATGNILDIPSATSERKKSTRFNGAPGAPGVGLGQAFVLSPAADLSGVVDKEAESIDDEIVRFDLALEAAREEIRILGEKLSSELRPEEMALFDVYLNMLDDHALGAEVKARIRDGNWAQGALRQVVMQYVGHFQLMEDVYLRERATDIIDLGTRILAHLQGSDAHAQEYDFPANTILVSEELTPAMLGEVPPGKLRGLVSVKGSSNSHVAILARAMGIPTVMGVVDVPYAQLHGLELIVDGYRGQIFSSPNDELREQYQAIFDEEQALQKDLQVLRDEPAETLDGHRIPLWVNTGLITDAVRSLERGAEGVGLYRTEVPFMMKDRFPSESEQQKIYRQQLETFAPNPVTMRTLDIGGDKALTYFPISEANPFLGWRGIRVTLDHPEIFLVQIRAMLKASEGLNNLRIMLPMITSVSEVDEALHLIYRAHAEVLEEGFDVEMPQVGVMIEVPAAVYQIRELGQRVDFLSVGSNDLTQYLLAVDRNNPRVADLYQAFHPAVLNALKMIADMAHEIGKPVSVCGELAGNPLGAVLLMAMGYDMLSMNATNLPKVKSVIRGISREWADQLLAEVLQIESAPVITATLQLSLEKAGFGRIIGPGRN
ncbi:MULTISPECIES: phosphoenolpyruvate--protein phosphotransferase [Oceanospirillaceae]|jgi:phosphotransferase system enzyme I (PtsP)|uniref:phosphoenolpyruvate--protein phosphotransferase n=1 Tax=Oceanospirillaceae TaxID=135620 RepID=UPI000C4989D1|nr:MULTISPECIES: phosphoenolpyruvate--protein phosphotransferase [Thalassolituus]MAY15417.1 phosphoenolpyruvate--protein phosphotransferase [Oceanospirillaceae bacterium]MBU2039082.1 phosphoenolpyruvate--protein phosphotransferase [Gammaproteobacteria bacterium]MCA6059188.1 phosphoenolpyruvate--protein phosphotransferase [Thalassolituus sp. ST750PaO-4]MCB2386511.1 phosphoenolpyruvate--protein phosphotransferase [Thalassolituus alkanivorans]MCB2422994.1 phosphoenolpyruvate--protein phosphotrans